MTDPELTLYTARRIAAGDPDIVAKFIRDHYATIYHSMRHLTRHREDAEDLTQQTFIVARAKIETFAGKSELTTWLHRIAFNEYAQWKRKCRPTDQLIRDHPQQDPALTAFVEGESLLAALDALPDKHREAIVLFEIERLSVEQVAAVVRAPVGTVKARLYYARRRLRVLLDGYPEISRNETKEATV